MYKVLYYQTARGRSPVVEFYAELDWKTRAKIYKHIRGLEAHGPNMVRPYADTVRGKIRELRVRFSHNNVRILYFFFVERQIVFLHGFLKKTDSIDKGDIEVAEQRMRDWMARYETKEE